MKWVLAVFGKAGSPFIADEVEKYVKRLRGGMFPLEVVELKESKLDDRVQSLSQEAALFEKKFPKSEYRRVILSEEGKLMDTVKLSDTLRDRFPGNIVFLDWFGLRHRREPEKDGGFAAFAFATHVYARPCPRDYGGTALPRADGDAEPPISS